MTTDADPASEPLARTDYRVAWRRDDPELERDAIAFWRRLGILPPGVSPEARAKELCCLGYIDGEVAAVSTASVESLPFLRARAALYRCATAPEHRRRWLVAQISVQSFAALERWSAEHPEAGVKGMAAILDTPMYVQMKRKPVWKFRKDFELVLIGHTNDGLQMRMAWFPGVRLDTPDQPYAG